MLIIPSELIDKFVSVSSNNVSKEDGKHLETLAFLSGTWENGNLIGSDLIFPKQNCQPNSVEDQGKITVNSTSINPSFFVKNILLIFSGSI